MIEQQNRILCGKKACFKGIKKVRILNNIYGIFIAKLNYRNEDFINIEFFNILNIRGNNGYYKQKVFA